MRKNGKRNSTYGGTGWLGVAQIEIARAHVSFQPDSVEAERATSAGRAIWRVTFRGRLSGQPPLLFETIIVEVDRQSGEAVSIARS